MIDGSNGTTDLEALRSSCIPCDCADEELEGTILKLAEYVVRNGEAFEAKVKEKESMNEKFSFLFKEVNNEGNEFYRWILCCMRHTLYSKEQIKAVTDLARVHLQNAPAGLLKLSTQDEARLVSMLQANTGSKDDVGACRKWILQRAHSISSIAAVTAAYVRSLSEDQSRFVSLQTGKLPSTVFNKIMLTIYIFNDVLVNNKKATMAGPYTRLIYNSQDPGSEGSAPKISIMDPMCSYLVDIFHAASCKTESSNEIEKLERMVIMWGSRQYISPQQQDQLLDALRTKEKHSVQHPSHVDVIPQSIFEKVKLLLPQPPPLPAATTTVGSVIRSPALPISHLPNGGYPPGIPLMAPIPPRPSLLGMPLAPPRPMLSALPPGMLHAPVHPGPLPPQLPLQPINGNYNNATPPVPSQYIPNPISQAGGPDFLLNCSVGTMANFVKYAIKSGHPRYAPLTGATIALALPPHIEPGRLDARITEFYRRLNALTTEKSETSVKRKWDHDAR